MTDKRASEHNYTQFYEVYFSLSRSLSITLLEIGVLEHPDKIDRPYGAASLRMWADYFHNSQIHGIDIRDLTHLQQERIHIHIGDQSKGRELEDLLTRESIRPNIIIDDGSHRITHQQITIAALFKHLSPRGIYVIEGIVQFGACKLFCVNADGTLIVDRAADHQIQ